jgi:hypothetical protein
MSETTSSRSGRRAYPPDEFDTVEPGSGRRGAHRAKTRPTVAMVPVLLVVLAVVAVVVGAMTLFGGQGLRSQEPNTGPVVADATDAPTASAGPTSSGTASPSAKPTSSATESATSTPSQTATVDTSAPLTVLNGTRTRGLAAKASEQLRGDGWTVATTDNHRGPTVPTTVYYPSEDLAATAEAIAKDLGGVHTEQSDTFSALTVVLGADYSP